MHNMAVEANEAPPREAPAARDSRPLIAHVIFSFDYGGLENGVVNVINGLPADRFRHAVVALTTATDFRQRIRDPGVKVYALGKRSGKDPLAYLRLYRLLRALRPSIVHTRNRSTIEGSLLARLAGVPYRIHGEHGWDVFDPEGASRKYRILRRLLDPAIDRFVVVSRELESWLTARVGIRPSKVTRICNGVDTETFQPREGRERRILPASRFPPGCVVVGTVTRFSAIKDPLNLVEGFIEARRAAAPGAAALRLVMIGDGALRAEAESRLAAAGLAEDSWLPGSRDDIPELMRDFDLFVLGSRREGISNTILEAMSSGLPIIATAAGGNPELITNGKSGRLVEPGSSTELAAALLEYSRDASLREMHGRAGRHRVLTEFSLRRMLSDYEALYGAYTATRQVAT